jgi:hypothetical protein
LVLSRLLERPSGLDGEKKVLVGHVQAVNLKATQSAVAVLFAGALAFEQFEQGFHLGHHPTHFARFWKQPIFLDPLVHFPEFLADVAQVTHDLLTLGLGHKND